MKKGKKKPILVHNFGNKFFANVASHRMWIQNQLHEIEELERSVEKKSEKIVSMIVRDLSKCVEDKQLKKLLCVPASYEWQTSHIKTRKKRFLEEMVAGSIRLDIKGDRIKWSNVAINDKDFYDCNFSFYEGDGRRNGVSRVIGELNKSWKGKAVIKRDSRYIHTGHPIDFFKFKLLKK